VIGFQPMAAHRGITCIQITPATNNPRKLKLGVSQPTIAYNRNKPRGFDFSSHGWVLYNVFNQPCPLYKLHSLSFGRSIAFNGIRFSYTSSPLVCRNICEGYSKETIFGKSNYSVGKKYCRRCEVYLYNMYFLSLLRHAAKANTI
jgi:hypothetical protein